MSEALSEAFIDAWLELDMVVRENRWMDGLTLNEIAVFHYLMLAEANGRDYITATELGRRMRLLKSQINGLLNKLFDRELLSRTRSRRDGRMYEIRMTEKGRTLYQQEHARMLDLVQKIIALLGVEEADAMVKGFSSLIQIVGQVVGATQPEDLKGRTD